MDLPHKLRHAELLHELPEDRPPLVVSVALDKARGAVELTVIAQDHRRLLSTIAGACAASGANIVDAHIFTTADGLALDTILCSRTFDFDEDEMRRGGRIAHYLNKALRGEIVISEAIRARSGHSVAGLRLLDRPRGAHRQFALRRLHGDRSVGA